MPLPDVTPMESQLFPGNGHPRFGMPSVVTARWVITARLAFAAMLVCAEMLVCAAMLAVPGPLFAATDQTPPDGVDHPAPATIEPAPGTPHPPRAPSVDLRQVTAPPTVDDSTADPIGEAEEDIQGPPLPPAMDASGFALLGSEIEPGTSARLSWTPDGGIGGLASPTPVLVINGARPGPTLCLTAAVHGDELNGIEIVRRVMYDIDPKRLGGRILGVPIVNLDGFRRGSRYLSDRRDLNRHFPGSPRGSLASRIAHSLLEEVLSHCNFLVDIHTGSLGRTNLPQVRADMRRDEVAEFTKGFGRIVVLHSPGSRGMLRREIQSRGIHTVTLEVGESQRLQSKPVDAGVRAINQLLQHLRMYPRLFRLGKPEPVYYESQWVRAPTGGILLNEVRLGAYVAQGQELGAVIDPITNVRTPIRARTHGRLIGMAVNQVVMPGFAAYHLGIEASDEEPIETEDLEPTVEEEIIEEEIIEGEDSDGELELE